MCCCAEFIVKYVLFGANLIFSLAGIALVAVGIAVLVQINEILELIPVNVNAIPIAVIVLGSIIFFIAFFGCCGAIRESRCLLLMYSICMAIIAAGKIYLAVVVFNALSTIEETVTGWLDNAFAEERLRPPFHILETLFRCCGTTGYESYFGVYPELPPSCCASVAAGEFCQPHDAFGGCTDRLSSYFETFGEAIGFGIIVIIIIEFTAMLFGLFLCWSIGKKRARPY